MEDEDAGVVEGAGVIEGAGADEGAGAGEGEGVDEGAGAGGGTGADEGTGAGARGGADEGPAAVAGFGAVTSFRARPLIDLGEVPGPVVQLLIAVRTPSARRQMERLISEADLPRTNTVGIATMARMVWPYSWLLDRVGDDGVKLTDAGHLPPAAVAAVIDELNLAAEGIAPVSRENQAPPVVQLRQTAQATGLVQKNRGRLELTARGAALRRDPAALWWHLAEQLPVRSAAFSEVPPGMILLACVAARFTDTLEVTVARMLTAIGWMNPDGSPLTGAEAAAAISGTRAVLRWLGALPARPPGRTGQPGPADLPYPPPEGVAFARAALSRWPGSGHG
ncbi:MAG: hypothetical protein JO016_04025 [Actinobacteria bacterium]|nr:hypothetical protein [Actinomycetota bacterium]